MRPCSSVTVTVMFYWRGSLSYVHDVISRVRVITPGIHSCLNWIKYTNKTLTCHWKCEQYTMCTCSFINGEETIRWLRCAQTVRKHVVCFLGRDGYSVYLTYKYIINIWSYQIKLMVYFFVLDLQRHWWPTVVHWAPQSSEGLLLYEVCYNPSHEQLQQ